MYVTAKAANHEWINGKLALGKGKTIQGQCYPTQATPGRNGHGFCIRLTGRGVAGEGTAERSFSVTLDEATIKLILRAVALHKPDLDPHHEVMQAAIALLSKPVVEPPPPRPSRPLNITLASLAKK